METDSDCIGDLKEVLICDICYDHLYQPRALLCGHSFCRSCIEQLNDKALDEVYVIDCPWRCIPAKEDRNNPIAVKNFALSKIVDLYREVILNFLNLTIHFTFPHEEFYLKPWFVLMIFQKFLTSVHFKLSLPLQHGDAKSNNKNYLKQFFNLNKNFLI